MSAPSNPPEALRVVRFGLVGLLNSVVGYSDIVIMLRSGAGDIAATVAGYAVGLTVGFVLNMRWTFERSGSHYTTPELLAVDGAKVSHGAIAAGGSWRRSLRT